MYLSLGGHYAAPGMSFTLLSFLRSVSLVALTYLELTVNQADLDLALGDPTAS